MEKQHLRFEMREAYENGATDHPQLVMKSLGITYQHSTPQSIADCWWFWNCEGEIKELPSYLEKLNIDPMDAIGHGLSSDDAINIKNNE